MVGFSEEKIKEYAKHSFGAETELFANFLTYFSANPAVRGMMYNPLNCNIVVNTYQYSHESGKPIPHTLTQLYSELTLMLLSRHKHKVGSSLALPEDLDRIYSNDYLCKQLVELGKFAFEGRVNEEVIFKEIPKECVDLGLLTASNELYKPNITIYTCMHLTLQEFLSAFYISHQRASKQHDIFMTHYGKKHLRVVWNFLCGLTKMQGIGWELFGEKMEKMSSGYAVLRNKIEVRPLFIQCLYESQDEKSCREVFSNFKVQAGSYNSTLFDIYAIGYCVSASSSVWSVNLSYCGFDAELVNMLAHGLNFVEHGNGSIMVLDISRNQIADKGMHYFKQLPTQILHQIKSLMLACCGISQEGLNILADQISCMSGLTTLDIEDNPVGEGSTEKLLKELEKHQRLKTLNMRSILLNEKDISALSAIIIPPSGLKKLYVGNTVMSLKLVESLVRTLLPSSSLETLVICIPPSATPLGYIDSISDTITDLKFSPMPTSSNELLLPDTSSKQTKTDLPLEGVSKLNQILRKNDTLKRLTLYIPMSKSELLAIFESLDNNKSLKQLSLSNQLHSMYFSRSEKEALGNRVWWQ